MSANEPKCKPADKVMPSMPASNAEANRTRSVSLAAFMVSFSMQLMNTMPSPRLACIVLPTCNLVASANWSRLNCTTDLSEFIVVEGPLAGGHLGFGLDDWQQYDLATITAEVLAWIKEQHLDIPVIPAGGIFTGTEATGFLNNGAAAVQVATRFTVTQEGGLPARVVQEYFKASEADVEVNGVSPTGYPMRMLKSSPAIGDGIRPNCEAYGYLLDGNGNCAYIQAYNREVAANPEVKKIKVMDKTCLCTQMHDFNCWTCGHYVYRLKDTSHRLDDGSYQVLSAEHVFKDYQFSRDGQVTLPARVESAN